MRARSFLLAATLPVWMGACSQAARPAPSTPSARPMVPIAVLPSVWVTPEPSRNFDATAAAIDGLVASHGVTARRATVPPPPETAEPSVACHDDLGCVRRIGGAMKARKVVVVKLAELGDTVLVRIAMIDVEGGTQEQTRQSVVRGAEPSRIAEAVRSLSLELARPFGPPPAPQPPAPAWYEHWWVWAGAGAVVAAGVATPLLLRGKDETPTQQPDVVIKPP